MKRNWDTIRYLLTKVEECTLPTDMVKLADFPSESAAAVSYHMELLIAAGLVDGQMSGSIGPDIKAFIARKLTWEGHEFLDSIRSNTVWERTKKVFAEQGVSMTFDLVKEGAKSVASALLGAAIRG